MRKATLSIVTLGAGLIWSSTAAAQVVINMPSPPKPAAQPAASAPDAAAQTMPSVGDVALARYSGVRTGTRNTYFSDRWYGGYRLSSSWYASTRFYWGYPYAYSGYWGWGWGWPGWSWSISAQCSNQSTSE